jgi:hypothetical protein
MENKKIVLTNMETFLLIFSFLMFALALGYSNLLLLGVAFSSLFFSGISIFLRYKNE